MHSRELWALARPKNTSDAGSPVGDGGAAEQKPGARTRQNSLLEKQNAPEIDIINPADTLVNELVLEL